MDIKLSSCKFLQGEKKRKEEDVASIGGGCFNLRAHMHPVKCKFKKIELNSTKSDFFSFWQQTCLSVLVAFKFCEEMTFVEVRSNGNKVCALKIGDPIIGRFTKSLQPSNQNIWGMLSH